MNRYIMKYCGLFLAALAIQLNAQTVDLSTHVSGTPPAGTVFQWHNSAAPSGATLLPSTTVTATATPVNYWVYYYDAANDCYSPGSKVTVITNSCPATTVDLTSIPATSAPAGTTLQWYTSSTPSAGTQVANPAAAGNGTYYPAYYDAANNCYSPAGTPVIVVTQACTSYCYKPGAGGTPDGYTKMGILTKPAITVTNWPENVPNGYIVMDSAGKGFVITHMTTAQRDALTPLKGMLIYNTDLKCVQLYRGASPTVDNTRTGWHCIERGCNE